MTFAKLPTVGYYSGYTFQYELQISEDIIPENVTQYVVSSGTTTLSGSVVSGALLFSNTITASSHKYFRRSDIVFSGGSSAIRFNVLSVAASPANTSVTLYTTVISGNAGNVACFSPTVYMVRNDAIVVTGVGTTSGDISGMKWQTLTVLG